MPSLVPLALGIVVVGDSSGAVERAWEAVKAKVETVWVERGKRVRGKAYGRVVVQLPDSLGPYSREATLYNMALHELAHRRYGKALTDLMPEGYASGFAGLYGIEGAHPLVATREDVLKHWREWPVKEVLELYVGTVFWSYTFILSLPPEEFKPPVYAVVGGGIRPYKVGGLLYTLAEEAKKPYIEWKERVVEHIYCNLKRKPSLSGPLPELYLLLQELGGEAFVDPMGEEDMVRKAVELLFSIQPIPPKEEAFKGQKP